VLGYGSLPPGATDDVCWGGSEDDGGGGAKLSRVDDGGGALPGPDDDNALDGRPSTHDHTYSHSLTISFHFDTPDGSTVRMCRTGEVAVTVSSSSTSKT